MFRNYFASYVSETALRLPASTSIVFDTKVLISAFIFKGYADQVYRYCAERYILYTSEWMLDKLKDVLSREKFRLPPTLQEEIIAQIKADSQVVIPVNQLPTNSPDPDDNYVLQTALSVQANFLITGDEKHLLLLKQVQTTEIIAPRTSSSDI
ncbi:putative toxin-antitoxin system toxin component, PIN family [Spirosoma soli]|uniref:Toxin-antitoxin system toxin component, PIN family n=1 Tax=Spirosoma soli TaxID=1770529 RepID=A0ABW5LZE5_9BACT